MLQPVIYGLALEAMAPENKVYSGRLSFCTTAGGFTQHEIPLLDDARSAALQVLEIVDRGVEHGLLAARPDRERLHLVRLPASAVVTRSGALARRIRARFADLDALRGLP